MSSILNDTKKVLGLDAGYTAFDVDVMMHINSVFSTLNQLGLGSDAGFMIEDADADWSDFLGADNRLNAVKTYVYLRVRLLFDPPTSSYALAAMEAQTKELEWRLNVEVEHTRWTDPVPEAPDDTIIFDGGGA